MAFCYCVSNWPLFFIVGFAFKLGLPVPGEADESSDEPNTQRALKPNKGGKVMFLTMGFDNSPYFLLEEIGQELQKRGHQVRNKIGTELIFTLEESISDFKLSNQNKPLCVLDFERPSDEINLLWRCSSPLTLEQNLEEPSKDRQIGMEPLVIDWAKEEAKMATIPVSQILNVRNSTVNKLHYHAPLPENVSKIFVKEISVAAKEGNVLKAVHKLTELQLINCDAIFNNSVVMREIENADLIVWIEIFYCAAILAEHAKKPHVVFMAVTPTMLGEIFKIPLPPSYVPVVASGLGEEMTFFQRVQNRIMYAVMNFLRDFPLNLRFKCFQKKHNVSPKKSLVELISSAEAALLQTHPAVEYAHPLVQNVFQVGPILPKPAKPLPEELESYLQESGDHGVILVSFGSTIEDIKLDYVKTMLNAFGRLKQRVLWKIQLPSDIKVPANVKTVNWLPQNDLLGHEKIRAFVSHVGANSMYEAAFHGVPVVAVPFSGDGPDNALKLSKKAKMAVTVDIHSASSDDWVKNIKEVIYEARYKSNATRVSQLIRGHPKTPVQLAADVIEYILACGGRVPHLRPYAHNLTWYQLHLLDVHAFLFLVHISISCVLYFVLRSCYRICKKTSAKKKQS